VTKSASLSMSMLISFMRFLRSLGVSVLCDSCMRVCACGRAFVCWVCVCDRTCSWSAQLRASRRTPTILPFRHSRERASHLRVTRARHPDCCGSRRRRKSRPRRTPRPPPTRSQPAACDGRDPPPSPCRRSPRPARLRSTPVKCFPLGCWDMGPRRQGSSKNSGGR